MLRITGVALLVPLAITLFTVQLMFWAVLVIIGTFFRGPGFNFVAPWDKGLFFEL